MKMIRRKLTIGYTLIATMLTMLLASTGAFISNAATVILKEDMVISTAPGQCTANWTAMYENIVSIYGEIDMNGVWSPSPEFPLIEVGRYEGAEANFMQLSTGTQYQLQFNLVVSDQEIPVLGACPQNKVELPLDATGVVVNYTLPTATDNCNQVVICDPAPGNFRIGITPVTCWAADEALNISEKCTFAVSVLSPLEIQKQVLQELMDLKRMGPPSSDLAKMIGGISQLSKSVDMKSWINGSHPKATTGESVFNNEMVAFERLAELRGDLTSPNLTFQSMIDRLLKANKILAEIAISEASSSAAAAATIELQNGNTAAQDGKVSSAKLVEAMGYYRNAWKLALGV